jgi:nitric oxide reductase subunit B
MWNADQGTIDTHTDSDEVSNILKWVLLITAIISFVVVGWGTYKTYQLAPPLPHTFLAPSGQILMIDNDIVAGKAGFQRADLMDYGSLYGMGSYFGEDYTAKYLVSLGRLTEEEIAQQRFNQSFTTLSEGDQYVVRKAMQQALQQVDLSHETITLSQPVTKAIQQLQAEIPPFLLKHNFVSGWTKAYSLNDQSALQTADFHGVRFHQKIATIFSKIGQCTALRKEYNINYA